MVRRIVPLLAGLVMVATAFAAPAAPGTATDAAGITRAQIGQALQRPADVPWLLLAFLITAAALTIQAGKRAAPRAARVSIRPPKVR